MSEHVKQAKDWSLRLISQEMPKAGSTENAMRQVARKCGVSYSVLWQLRYRAPQRIFADVYLAIQAQYEATREHQAKKLEHELRLREAAGRGNSPLVRAARAIGGIDGDEG